MTWTTILILCLCSTGLGVGGTLGIQALGRDRSPEVVEEVAGVVEAAAAGTTSAVEAAQEPEVLEAQTRLAVVEAPAVNLAVAAAVEPDASPATVALAGYLACLAASQAQQQGSGAFGCQARGEELGQAIRGMATSPSP